MDDSVQKKEAFSNALQNKKIPILTLDHKWYRLLDDLGRDEVKELEEELNALLKRQGRLNTESNDIRKLKKKLMNEIVPMADEVSQGRNGAEHKIEEHKRLIEECNEKLDSYRDELLELPRQIEKLNYELMFRTMESCYRTMHTNTDAIEETEKWVTQIRIELKKRLIAKQEMEQRNQEIYSYMHDIFGVGVLNLFDMKYDPEGKQPGSQGKDSAQE